MVLKFCHLFIVDVCLKYRERRTEFQLIKRAALLEKPKSINRQHMARTNNTNANETSRWEIEKLKRNAFDWPPVVCNGSVWVCTFEE